MNSMILGLLAETSIHPGAGQSAGFVDLPVAREAATDYPVIVGSSMKGALRDRAREAQLENIDSIFGKQETGGTLLVSDARLILLPVRSLKSQYKWVTCPHLIERLSRDMARSRCLAATPAACAPDDRQFDALRTALESSNDSTPKYLGQNDGDLFLEERQFSNAGNLASNCPGLIDSLKPLIAHQPTADRIDKQLVVISDNDFVWFARYGLSVNARNVLHETKKTSENLWYEETIPPDALFYWLLAQRSDQPVAGNDDALTVTRQLLMSRRYIQVGGNETVGQGWFAVALPNTKAGA